MSRRRYLSIAALGLIPLVMFLGFFVWLLITSQPAQPEETAAVIEYGPTGTQIDPHAAIAAAIEEWVSAQTTTTQPSAIAHTVTPRANNGSEEAFFACVRWRESRGDYTAINPTGTFRGAYQFYQGGWDTFAAQVAPAYVGVPPDQAPPAIQDAVAHAAFVQLGKSPWGGVC